MPTYSPDDEGLWLASLDSQRQVSFLTALSHGLTVAAREAYVPQADAFEHPRLMRNVNEIQHRVAACTLQILYGETNESFVRAMAGWVLRDSVKEFRGSLRWTWNRAKEQLAYLEWRLNNAYALASHADRAANDSVFELET